jgi:hypothetical protein
LLHGVLNRLPLMLGPGESSSDVILRLAASGGPWRAAGAKGRLSEPCGRRGRYNVERLVAAHGTDARLPDLLATLASEKSRSFSIYDRCKARFGGLTAR